MCEDDCADLAVLDVRPVVVMQERRTGITQHALNLVATACKEGGLLDEAMRWALQRRSSHLSMLSLT